MAATSPWSGDETRSPVPAALSTVIKETMTTPMHVIPVPVLVGKKNIYQWGPLFDAENVENSIGPGQDFDRETGKF